jgi:hypothetical protein
LAAAEAGRLNTTPLRCGIDHAEEPELRQEIGCSANIRGGGMIGSVIAVQAVLEYCIPPKEAIDELQQPQAS